mmetsp:Transcript_26070/g.45931  ORF Transcript_26070/g.45931 Transcript_26070/m.45931 type:complete len:200 (-) Transcript_26070:170-769(-)
MASLLHEHILILLSLNWFSAFGHGFKVGWFGCKFLSRSLRLLVGQVIQEGFRFSADQLFQIWVIVVCVFVDTAGLHFFKGGSVSGHPRRNVSRFHRINIIVISEFNVFNGSSVGLTELLRHFAISDGFASGQVVDLVAVGFSIQQDNHGSVCHIVWADIVNSHAIGRRDVLVVLGQSFTLSQEWRSHQMASCQDGVRNP